jgi:putative transposase
VRICGQDDGVVTTAPVLSRVGPFADFLGAAFDEAGAFFALRHSEITGRPIGPYGWIERLEQAFARPARAARPAQARAEAVRSSADSQHDLFGKLSP